MAIKTTSLKDVFRRKSEEFVMNPDRTVWLDEEGNTHYMEGLTQIIVMPSKEKFRTGRCKPIYPEEGQFAIDGTLLQVGNTVRSVRNVTSLPSNKNFIDKVDLSRLFRFAKNLEIIDGAFSYIKDLTTVPEDLLWGCPKLKRFSRGFAYSGLEEIPENIFAKNPELEYVSYCFHYATNLKEIPEKLFSNCHKLNSLDHCFSGCGITSIPECLLDVFKVDKETKYTEVFLLGGGTAKCINTNVMMAEMFANCIGLFDIPENLLKRLPGDVYFFEMFKDSTFGKVQMSITQDLDPIKQRYNESKVVKKYLSDHAKEDYEKGKMDLFFEIFGERLSSGSKQNYRS